MAEGDALAREAAENAARSSYGKLIAFLAARTRDVAAAEDALSEAFAAALADWPKNGVPDSPEGWLLTAARRRQIDGLRRARHAEEAAGHLLFAAELAEGEEGAEAIPDDRLRLMFACAHPAIDAATRAPLMLQTTLGFDAAAIASAFLVSPATMGQRLVRAKQKIRKAGVPFRVPEPAELPARLEVVLDAIYAAFAEGWSDPEGTEARRRNLADEAIWLGRLAASLLPEPEALGLLALMLYAEARRRARRGTGGEYVPLAEQDPKLWDAALIEEAETLLFQASRANAVGRYQLEAAVQSAHVVRRREGREQADWSAIVQLYDALLAMTASPVVAINRAVALAETRGAAAGLAALDALAADPRLAEYQPYWAARADVLARAGRTTEADSAFRLAIGLEGDPAVRRFLQHRRDALSK